MKREFRFQRFRLSLVIMMMLTLLLIGCGGGKQPVKTEPGSSTKAEEGTLERFKPENESQTTTENEKEKAASDDSESNSGRDETGNSSDAVNTTAGENRTNHETGELILARDEVIPVIIKDENKPQTTLQTTGQLETAGGNVEKNKEIADSISSGIAGIFRGFGYTGTVEVPENFKRRVAHYIRYFSQNKKGAGFYRRAMKRGSRYLPMIRKVLKEKHLPLSLAYLPVIESGFITNARSRASAVGMWQFMRGTARMYGLKVNYRVDQRKDPVKSTIAAAEYLNDLLAMFGAEDPFLGISAYNAGEGKIMGALRKISYKERSFWTLVRKNLLRTETDQYIPRILAVVL
ncbi:MAG: lytic transglycosylase domain-containing protein, partial [bacterium]|nr:lytic transglycosylase domain-containing protein [bacterium]